MRLTVKENSVLAALNTAYPRKLPFNELSEATSINKDALNIAVSALSKAGFVDTSSNNAVCLGVNGKKHFGITGDGEKVPKKAQAKKEAVKVDADKPTTIDKQISIDIQLNAIEEKLTEKPRVVNDVAIKTQVLERLSSFLSDDIAEVLMSIKGDLEAV